MTPVAPDPPELNLAELGAGIEVPDPAAIATALEWQTRPAGSNGALGRLDELAVWLAGVQGRFPPRDPGRVRLVVVAGDHGIAGPVADPATSTADLVRRLLAGTDPVAVLAELAGATVRVVDAAVDADTDPAVARHKVRRGSGRIDREDALTYPQVRRAIAAGMAVADEEVDAGADLLIAAGAGAGGDTAAAVLVAAITHAEPVEVAGAAGSGADTAWMRALGTIRDALRRSRPVAGDPVALLAAVGGADLAALTGLLLQAAVRRTPVLLDGVVPAAAALVARELAATAVRWWLAGHRCPDAAQRIALHRLDLQPVLDLGIRLDAGTGALIALPVLRAAAQTAGDLSGREP